jgi:WD and tetratricopeptide repeats protein 1
LRFIGHCNTKTDIKEANFFGQNGEYVVAGSDDGNFFLWERKTLSLRGVYKADKAIVNCVQPHPTLPLLATSGIDHEISIWNARPIVRKFVGFIFRLRKKFFICRTSQKNVELS